jgi:hypothetical protein
MADCPDPFRAIVHHGRLRTFALWDLSQRNLHSFFEPTTAAAALILARIATGKLKVVAGPKLKKECTKTLKIRNFCQNPAVLFIKPRSTATFYAKISVPVGRV